jgi:hypothetical protein
MKHRPSLLAVAASAVALVAVSGGSYAAGLITGADVKNGSLTGADIKNKSLTKKDFKGSVTGPQGPQGPAGPFPGVLPSGKTLTGVYSITGVATKDGQYFDVPISFGFSFASAPDVVLVGKDDTVEEAAAAGCPGSADAPGAAPGNVCVYEMGATNVEPDGTTFETDGDQANIRPYTPPDLFGPEATTFGTVLEIYSAAAGDLYSNGTWAATSP